MAQGHHLHLRLFLEGIEVPVISAVVQVAANAPATASIQIIPTDRVLDLLPRTVVHLFFYDYVEAGHVALDQKKEELEGRYEDWFNSRYKLLFMGELVTIKFQKTAGSRAVVLECADFSNYWDTTFQYNFGGSLFGGRRQASFIGANSNFFTSPLGHGVGTISRLLNGNSINYPKLKGLLAGIVRMLEAIGGSYYGKNAFRGCNDFTSIAELRLKILQQITAAEEDDSTAKLFARKAFSMWMNRQSQSLGKLVSFRGLVKTMFSFIFHEVYPCPVAMYVAAHDTKESFKRVVNLRELGEFKAFAKRIDAAIEHVRTAQGSLQDWRTAATTDRGVIRQRTTTYMKNWKVAERAVKALFAEAMAKNPPTVTGSAIAHAQGMMDYIRSMSSNSAGVISANWDPDRGTLDRNYNRIYQFYARALEQLRIAAGGRPKKKYGKGTRTVQKQARINNQIFRPDVWYSAPPRCNVLFPETYDHFSFSRQFLREVSRLELQTHNEILGNHALFNGRYYAPNVEDVRRGVKLSSRRFARLIMDHELFTGIIPMFENMSEVNVFAMRGGKVKRSGEKVPYAQRAVNFQYFKYRFDARTLEASGRFNPFIVPGFPSLIIDKYMNEDRLRISSLPVGDQIAELGLTVDETPTRTQLLRQLVSPQYLGVCAGLSHSVAQEGGRTSYNFIHARVHRESAEYLGVDKAEVRKPAGTRTKTTPVASPKDIPPKVKGRGPNGGVITAVKDISAANQGKSLDVYQLKIKGIVGEEISAGLFKANIMQELVGVDLRSSVGTEVGKALKVTVKKTAYVLGAYDITERYTHYERSLEDIPIEEAIRPPWIWKGWAVPKISDTYEQLIGIRAVTDIAGYLTSDQLSGLRAQQEALATTKDKRSKSAQKSARSQATSKAAENQNALTLKEKEMTIENSIDLLVRAYSYVKVNNLDVGDFLRAYSWRPVATIVDILGGSDLKIKQVSKVKYKTVKKKTLRKQGTKTLTGIDARDTVGDQQGRKVTVHLDVKPVQGTEYVKVPYDQIGYEVTGTEGFHSRAFGDVEDLFGLVSPTVTTVLKLSGERRKIAARMDVRKRRREVVRAYVAELTHSKGLLG